MVPGDALESQLGPAFTADEARAALREWAHDMGDVSGFNAYHAWAHRPDVRQRPGRRPLSQGRRCWGSVEQPAASRQGPPQRPSFPFGSWNGSTEATRAPDAIHGRRPRDAGGAASFRRSRPVLHDRSALSARDEAAPRDRRAARRAPGRNCAEPYRRDAAAAGPAPCLRRGPRRPMMMLDERTPPPARGSTTAFPRTQLRGPRRHSDRAAPVDVHRPSDRC